MIVCIIVLFIFNDEKVSQILSVISEMATDNNSTTSAVPVSFIIDAYCTDKEENDIVWRFEAVFKDRDYGEDIIMDIRRGNESPFKSELNKRLPRGIQIDGEVEVDDTAKWHGFNFKEGKDYAIIGSYKL
jgi:hypothetical protein